MTQDLPPLQPEGSWLMRVVVGATTLLLALYLTGIWHDLGKPFPGFFVTPWQTVGPIRAAAIGEASPQADDRLVEIDRESVRHVDQLWERLQSMPPDHAPTYTFARDGKLYRARIAAKPLSRPLFAATFGPLVLVGLAYWLMALMVYRMRPDLEASQAFVYFAATIAIIGVGAADFSLHHRLSAFWFAALPLSGGLLIRLGLVFPRRLPIAEIPPVRRLPLLIAGTLAVMLLLCLGLATWSGMQAASLWGQLLGRVTVGWFAICAVLGLALLVVQVRQSDQMGYRQLQVVTVGSVAALAPIFLLCILPYVTGHEPLVPINAAAAWLVLLPVSLGFAILRYGLWDVRLLVRRSLSYGLTGLVLAGVYLALMAVLELAVDTPFDDARWTAFATAVTVALLFMPVKERVNALLAKVYHRSDYDVSRALEQTAERLATSLELDRVAEQVMAVVNETLHPIGGCLLLIDETDGRYQPVATSGRGPSPTLAGDSPWVAMAREQRQIVSRSYLPTRRRHLVEPALGDLGAELLVPLMYESELLGLLLLSAKQKEEAYRDSDLGLLRTLAGQTALALHNARQVAEIKAINLRLEQMVAERTRELESVLNDLQATQSRLVQSEKMVSLGLLVAGVAHEINNPAAVVIGNLELIKETHHDLYRLLTAYDGLELSSHMAELIETIKGDVRYPDLLNELDAMTRDCMDASKRIRAIVADLRNFSRQRADKPMTPTDVRQGLQTTLNLVRSLFRKDRITLQADFEDVPPVLGDPSQLNQVFMNLLVNAAQAIDGKGEVHVRLSGTKDDVRISISDTGCGIAAEHLPRLFDPFFTTKKQGVGTGLGLSISYGIIERHGGHIDVTSELGKGSTFTIVLPALKPEAQTPDAG